MRDTRGRFTAKGIVIPLPNAAIIFHYLIFVVLLLPWIYAGCRLNIIEKINTLIQPLFSEECNCQKNQNGEY